MEPIKIEEYKGYKIKIITDENPLNPREEFDCFCVIAGENGRYKIGDGGIEKVVETVRASRRYLPGWEDETSKTRLKFDMNHFPDAIKAMQACDDIICLPLFMYDHSGIALSIEPLNDAWDSGQVGVAFVTRENALKEFNEKRMNEKIRQKAIELIKSEVKTYSEWASGSVFGYVVEDKEGNEIDSCWGFYGMDEFDNMIEQGREAIDNK